ncbi:MAG: integral rane sensor signal transduction histidine kinase [Bacilli bacterium]|nr:integral rane sensor signal transduction histidine kinase [Bacilli bacterium]
MNLRKKMFLAFVGFIIVPLFMLGLVIFFISQNIIEKKYGEQTEQTLKAVGTNLTYIMKEMNNFSNTGIVSESIQNVLKNGETVSTGTNGNPNDELLYMNEAERSLRLSFLNHPSVYSAVLYNSKGLEIRATRSNYTSYNPPTYANLVSMPIYQEILQLNGLSKWFGPYEHQEISGEGAKFTQARIIKNLTNLENKGLLILHFDLKDINSIFDLSDENHSMQDTRFMLVNHEGLIMYDNRNILNGTSIYMQVGKAKLNFNQPYTSQKMQFNNIESVLSIYDMDLGALGADKWSLVSVTSWKYLSGDSIVIVQWVVAILLLCIICALLFNVLFVNGIIRSMIQVVRSMRLIEDGNLDVRIRAKGKDETGLLITGFNSLVERIGSLIDEVKQEHERKKRAELMLMQAQIKPHFLFNTLESINVLAMQNEGKKVSQMVQRLGRILRISIHPNEEITIRQEMEHLKSYLDIQKFRFEELFDYEIDVSEALMNYTMLKLTLQPLVENSIQHGFEGVAFKGFIHISAVEEKERIVIEIKDNGVGIANETLMKFWYKEEIETGSDEAEPYVLGERRGLGVRNVADRLRIQYGNGFGIYICSEWGRGTIIKCLIPKKLVG